MGLRLLAEAVIKNKPPLIDETNKGELFFKAEKYFSNFLSSIKIEKGGFLIKNEEDFYELCFPSGLDITTFHRCVIPAETFEPALTSLTEWTALKSGNFSSLRNFFSSQEYISITDIHIFPLEAEKAFLFLLKSQKDVSREEFNFTANTNNLILQYNKYKNIFKTAKPVYPFQYGKNAVTLKVKAALNADNFACLTTFSFTELFPDTVKLQSDVSVLKLYYSVINKILQIIGRSNISVLKTNRTLALCLFSAQKLPQDIYVDKIKSSIYPIYGKDFCDRIIIEYSGFSKDVKTVMNFLEENTQQ
ncbi:hypothetical protein [Treponema pedis]|uniref:Uncharacterized protein n=1 Tax=Treponema pedis TaxID=409322 RepID=A0A7S6WM58_9SPIR|nr:hypothetical protein [Treponema pedis]QOW59714.1 hypothetical protein IFE08_07450 [Treponema pedis]